MTIVRLQVYANNSTNISLEKNEFLINVRTID